MFKRTFLGILALSLGLGSAALTQERDLVDKDGERIAGLVKELGSAKFADREKAKKELEGIGTPALEALKKASSDENLETSKRAQELVRKIEDRMLTAEMLNPKRVRLNVNEKPVLEAVAELSRLSGYNLQVVGDRAALTGKNVTIDTGDVPFWEALDQLCAKAGLNEQITTNASTFPGLRPPIIRRGGIKIRALPKVVPGVLPVLPPAQDVPAPPLEVKPNKEALQVVDEPADKPAEKPQPAPKKGKVKGVIGQAIALPGVVIGPVLELPAIPDGIAPPMPGPGVGSVQLTPGVHKSLPTSYAGSVRVRALSGKNLPASTPKGTGLTVVLDALGEPRLQGFQLVGTPIILKAVDDLGQELTVSMEAPKVEAPMQGVDNIMIFNGRRVGGMEMVRQQTITFQKGEKTGKMLKELKGTITAQAKIPNEVLVKIENVMAAAGKKANGANGGSLAVESVEKQADGTIRVKVVMENLQPNPFGGGFGGGIVINGGAVQVIQIGPGGAVINGGPAQRGMPDLVDARGNKFQHVGVPAMRTNVNGGTISQEATILYRAPAGAGEPTSLVMFGERAVNFQVPFSFRDVPLE